MSTPQEPSDLGNPKKDTLLIQVESYAREEPEKAMSAAFGVGILLTLLPLGGLVSGLGRLVLLIARPLLMILGLVKVAEELDSRRPKAQSDSPMETIP